MKWLIVSFLLMLACVGQNPIADRNQAAAQNVSSLDSPTPLTGDKCEELSFRYLVVRDNMQSPVLRQVEVFLDSRAFSEENLTKLFQYLSKKYVDAESLIVIVKTAWEQFPLPSDCVGMGSSRYRHDPSELNFHQATFRRRGKTGSFRYNPVLKISQFKTVTVELQ